ncbi:MAG: alanyl-tRNA editing protein [Clostridia bacterium]|nr:alanyl-tRNA editing protein [Clostridia bacterium]
MTEKLYYEDAYIKDFSAEVLSVTECDGGFDVILDKTAFFPEEGGQSADTGVIGNSSVSYVYEKEGIVHHITKTAPPVGVANCQIDFGERFEKMQLHTAEHILCGIIHKLYGLENVGFHLGEEEVVFDVNGTLSREELNRVEEIANEAVFSNIEIETFFPDSGELGKLEYRAKLDITENVRIVKIGDVDSCACCAPHVHRTGEIGLIKILEFMKHRGGTRIWMVAGRRALSDYRKKYSNIQRISALLSAPQHDTADALEKYMKDADGVRSLLKSSRVALAEAEAKSMPDSEENVVVKLNDYSIDELRAFVNAYKARVGGLTVAISGRDGDYKYVIASNDRELSQEIKKINESLSGRGGGRGFMVQGSFLTDEESIRAYFK